MRAYDGITACSIGDGFGPAESVPASALFRLGAMEVRSTLVQCGGGIRDAEVDPKKSGWLEVYVLPKRVGRSAGRLAGSLQDALLRLAS